MEDNLDWKANIHLPCVSSKRPALQNERLEITVNLNVQPRAGLLNVLWRTTRDFCLYGITYAASKLGGQVAGLPLVCSCLDQKATSLTYIFQACIING